MYFCAFSACCTLRLPGVVRIPSACHGKQFRAAPLHEEMISALFVRCWGDVRWPSESLQKPLPNTLPFAMGVTVFFRRRFQHVSCLLPLLLCIILVRTLEAVKMCVNFAGSPNLAEFGSYFLLSTQALPGRSSNHAAGRHVR